MDSTLKRKNNALESYHILHTLLKQLRVREKRQELRKIILKYYHHSLLLIKGRIVLLPEQLW